MYGPSKYHWAISIVRSIFSTIDTVIYLIIESIYQIFFNVASSTLLSGEIIRQLFSRVQLILGIIILFKMSISLINGIINPDSILDSQKGITKIVTRIIVTLIMLVLIVPLNIPEDAISDGSYEAQLNNNGILFGTMYEFQNRVLSQNTMAKLILGRNIGMTELQEDETIADAGKSLSTTILKTFITVNLASEDIEKSITTDEEFLEPSNRMCQSGDSNTLVSGYLTTNNYRAILNMVNDHCGEGYFVFNYSFLISTIVGIVFVVIMVGFTMDMAIRAFKLAILRLIAPIPIISYIDPKSESGAFGNWSKAVISTYIDVFIRVAIVYFIIFVIDTFTHTGIIINTTSGVIGLFSKVFIYLGLFYFAKEAPKFITDSLGIKESKGIFGGIGRMMGGASTIAGVGAVAKGAVTSAITGWNASKDSQEARGVDRNRLVNAGSAIASAISGTSAGVKTFREAKDHQGRAVNAAIRSRNEAALEAGHKGASFMGTMQDRFRLATGRDTRSAENERTIAANQQFSDLYDKIAAKADVTAGEDYNFTYDEAWVDYKGRKHIRQQASNGNVKELKERYERIKASGSASEIEIQNAENMYKAAQAATIEAHIASGNRNDIIYQYYEQAKVIADARPEILSYTDAQGNAATYNLSNASDFKLAHFNAQDLSSSMQHGAGAPAYNAAKADADRAKNNK